MSWRPVLTYLLLSSAVGLGYAILNFPNVLASVASWFFEQRIVRDYTLQTIQIVRETLENLVGTDAAATFSSIMTFNFVCLWLFFAVSVLYSIRYLNARFTVYSLAGVSIGAIAIHALAWCFTIVSAVVSFVLSLFAWFGELAEALFRLLFSVWWLFAIALVAVVLYINLPRWHVVVGWLSGVGGFAASIYLWGSQLWQWLVDFASPLTNAIQAFATRFLWPVLAVVGAILVWLLWHCCRFFHFFDHRQCRH